MPRNSKTRGYTTATPAQRLSRCVCVRTTDVDQQHGGQVIVSSPAAGHNGGAVKAVCPREMPRAERWAYSAPLGARLCDLLCFGTLPKVPSWHAGSLAQSPSSESLSSISRWGAGDHEDEVVSMASTQEIGDSENFAGGDQIENIINKLNGTPRSADSAESIRELLFECVQAGGGNARENMALYFAMKRGLEFGMLREAIDETIEEAASKLMMGAADAAAAEVAAKEPQEATGSAGAAGAGVDQSVEVGESGAAPLAGGLLPPPAELEPGLLAGAVAVGQAAPPPPSSRAGSLQ